HGDLAGTGTALLRSRALWEHRAVVLAADAGQAVAGLRGVERGTAAPDVVTGVADPAGSGRVVWVFPGQGAQWDGMGRELWDTEPVFAAKMAACERALAPHVGWSLSDVLRRAPGAPSLARVDVVQPVSFAVMVSLAALWESCGVRPDAVLGHSQGEIAAACVAGALSLADAARIVAVRSQVIATGLAGRGGMLSVAIGEERARAEVVADPRWAGRVELAAVNSPDAVVVAGEPGALDEIEAGYLDRGVRVRRIPVDYASHTGQVAAVEAELTTALAGVTGAAPAVPWYSTVDGDWVTGRLDAAYWYRNLRTRVGFAAATRALGERGHRVFLEVSSHPVLTTSVQATLDDAGAGPAVVCGTLRRNEPEQARFRRSAAELFACGVELDWAPLLPGAGGSVALPTTAFQEDRYWLVSGPAAADASGLGLVPLPHPLLGAAVEDPETGGVVLTGRLSVRTHPWLADHAVSGAVVVPGAALVELAIQGGDRVGLPVLDELVVEAPLVLPDAAAARVRVVVGAEDAGRRPVAVHA
ncbi:MAG: acyltransferase domain-containing protein, partial [Actinoallomurus sp.]